MPFADYEQVTEPLALRYRGKVYTLPEIGIQDHLRLRLVLDPETDDDMTVPELEQLLLGAAGEQMVVDNVPARFRERAFRTATAEFRYGREIAEQVWNLPEGTEPPKAPEAEPAASTGSKASPSTDEATSTPSPARTTGTRTSRRKPAQSGKTPA